MMISNNLAQRFLSAVVLVPLVFFAFQAGGLWWQGLLAVVASTMAAEWFRITQNGAPNLWALFLGVIFLCGFFIPLSAPLLYGGVLFSALLPLLTQKNHKILCFLGGPAILFPLASLYAIGQQSSELLVWLILTIWATDVMAMVFGKTIGGPKLAPKISPQKTWAGLGGALFGSFLVTVIFALWHNGLSALFFIAPLVAVLAQGGDLLESALKRHFKVKDSGHLIPGHGGVLDRMDSFILAAPFFLLILPLIL